MRLNIMLADSDPENIKNFKTYIRLTFPDIKIVASLASPVDFIERVKEFSPNLILADIRFFGAVSYRTIRSVNEYFPDVRFILYGHYNDSEYMQKVVEFGVIDYIYRPVKATDLSRSLKHANEIFTSLIRKRGALESLSEEYKKNMAVFKDKFLHNLVNGNLVNKFEIDTSINYFNIPLTPDYTVMILRIDHFKKIILALDEKDKHLLVFHILSIIEQKLKTINNGTVFIDNLNELIIILGGSLELDKIISLGEDIRNTILSETRQSVTIGVGRTYKNLTEIAVSCKEASAALRYRSYIGYNTVIPIHYVEPMNNITYRYPLIKEEVLVCSAVIGEYKYCENLLKQLIEALKESGPLPEYLLSKIVMNIVISINRYASEQNILIGNEFTKFFPTKDIFSITTTEEAYDYLSDCLRKFCGHVVKIRNENKSRIVDTAKKYIEEKYMMGLTIAGIALHCNTTPEFLLNTFNEIERKTINEYINNLRIEKAKELIKTTESSDDMIAVQVGYANEKTLRTAFRKYSDMPLIEYRNKIKALS